MRWRPVPGSLSRPERIGRCGSCAPPAAARPELVKENAARKTGRHLVTVICGLSLQQTRAARPLVLGAEHLDRVFSRVSIGRNAVLIEILSGFLHLDVAGE